MRITVDNWLDAQNSVLGAALIEPRVVPKIMAETTEDDFSGPCKTVYTAMRKLFHDGFPVDPVSISAALGSDYRNFLVQLMEVTPTAANVDNYIRLCKERSRVLRAQELAGMILQAEDSAAIRELLERTSGLMVENSGRKTSDMSEALRSFMERHSKEVRYLSWPFKEFNDRLFSEPGDFIILGAEPSVGKTALALQCAWHWSRSLKVGFFSFETSTEKLFDRLMSSLIGLDMKNIKTNNLRDKDWERVCAASTEVPKHKLDLIQAAGMSASDIRARILEKGYQLIIVDYLQLLASKGGSRYEQVTNISIDLHNMAQGLGVTVLALSQLSRSDDDHKPRNSDLRESGQLEQDADVIIMLKLQKHTNPTGPRELYVTKNKEGELFMMQLAFDGRFQRFVKARVDGSPLHSVRPPDADIGADRMGTYFGQMSVLPNDTPVPFSD